MDMPGRIQVDILKVVQRDYEYKFLSFRCCIFKFYKGNVTSFENKVGQTIISDNIKG